NNTNHDKNDPFSKLKPSFDQLNNNFMKFGAFSDKLSVDGEMWPPLCQNVYEE
ncbi:hypothetical protein HHI36_016214, partial [Cryptolaemus montrouzieri]